MKAAVTLTLGMTFLIGCSAAPPSPAAANATRISDAEIAGIVIAANTIDADLGELATARGTEAAVREFGRTMTRDHRAVNAQASALVARLGVTPVASDVSRKLQADAAAFRTRLSAQAGSEFDRAYLANEVSFHRAVIEAVDGLLIPAAHDAELRQTLVSVRPAFVAHLEHAEQLTRTIK